MTLNSIPTFFEQLCPLLSQKISWCGINNSSLGLRVTGLRGSRGSTWGGFSMNRKEAAGHSQRSRQNRSCRLPALCAPATWINSYKGIPTMERDLPGPMGTRAVYTFFTSSLSPDWFPGILQSLAWMLFKESLPNSQTRSKHLARLLLLKKKNKKLLLFTYF